MELLRVFYSRCANMSCLAFRTTALLVLFLLLAGSALQTHARELRCKCVKVVSHRISTGSIASVDFIPEGPHCIKLEVIELVTCDTNTIVWLCSCKNKHCNCEERKREGRKKKN